jgi:hypothetical protein
MASVSPEKTLAQSEKGSNRPEAAAPGRQAPAAPGSQHNMRPLTEIMRKIHQLLHQGPLTPKQTGQVSDLMTRLGVMMQEMSGPQAEKYQSQHQRQLDEMKNQLEEIKNQLKGQKRSNE